MRKALILAAVCALGSLGMLPAYASCPPGALTPVSTGTPIRIVGCPDGKPVAGYVYQLSSPAGANSGPNDIVCEKYNPPSCNYDPSDTGTPNGQVTIETDWTNPGFIGCPTPNRLVLALECNDGSGALISIGNCPTFGGYNVEMAFPFDAATSTASPLDVGPTPTGNALQNNGRPNITSFARTAGMDQAMVDVPVPVLQSDCTLGTLGEALSAAGACDLGCGTFTPTLARGGLYTSTQPCSDTDPRPTVRAKTSWTSVPVDAAGHAAVQLPTPTNGNCNFIGTTANTGGGETSDIVGWVVLGGPTAASPVAEAVRVVRKGGSIEVTFKTSSELSLAGFNVFASGKVKGEVKLNAALVPSTGVGGAGSSYKLSYAVGDLKGNRGIIVESVLLDGSTLRAPLVEF